ncbi:MAG: glycosyltransferase family 4 protein [Patescibacteria group bacterium]|nr:glycosyltransferase family 4 protein [Patescibacteria group bacterium]
MKIVFVSDSIYPFFKGGKEKRIYEITTRLAKHGHEVHIFTMKWWQGERVIKKDNITLHGISKLYPLYNKKNKRRSIKQALLFSLSVFFPLLKEKFDIIEADQVPYFQLFPLKLVTLLKRKKLNVSWLEVWGREYWMKYLGWKGLLGYLVEKFSAYLPDNFIAISELTKDKLIKKFNVSANKIVFIPPTGIDQNKFTNFQKLKSSDCIYFGRLLNHKNVNLFIEAINILKIKKPEIKCKIIGEGPEKESLLELTEIYSLKDNIEFLDSQEENMLFSYINASKVFVFPSTREGFGISVLEANACGKQAVVIDHEDNAAKDLVIDKITGHISRFDKLQLAQKIELALRQYKDGKIKQACFKKASEYKWSKIIDQISRLYNTI